MDKNPIGKIFRLSVNGKIIDRGAFARRTGDHSDGSRFEDTAS